MLVVGKARATRAVRQALSNLPTPVSALVAGLSGADRAWVQKMWLEILRDIVPDTPCWVVGDYEVAWSAHTAGAPGVVAVLGTGSVCYGQSGTQRIKIGGYGWKIGDAGSGIRLGQLAVNAALEAMDRLRDDTALIATVLKWAKAQDREELLAKIYAPGTDVRSLAELAPRVLRQAHEDRTAHQLVVKEAQSLTDQLHAVFRAFPPSTFGCVGLVGGLARLWHPFLHAEARNAGLPSLVVVPRAPDVGAAMMARQFLLTRDQGH